MFWTRLASGIVLVAVTIALMVNGGWPLFWVVTAISLIGLFELYRVADLHKTPPAVIGYISSVVLDILILDGYYEYLILWLILTLMVMMACYVIAYPKYHTDQMTLLFFGLVYVTIMMSFIFKVRYLEGGILTVWLIFVASWGSDTCAYCAGKLFGKHKLPSKLSPNKTIEGCLGGIIGAALIGFLFALAFYRQETEYWWLMHHKHKSMIKHILILLEVSQHHDIAPKQEKLLSVIIECLHCPSANLLSFVLCNCQN